MVYRAWARLVDRVNQAADQGYDVVDPDVLSDVVWDVAKRQAAAGRIGLRERCELFIRTYDALFLSIDQQFPARAAMPREWIDD
ncbi:MAG TPA: hypothetical protein VFO19_02705 [Vicinamibacterales bacterium]|nr:hypothetical protein [Vicinamibacterales bacterium]